MLAPALILLGACTSTSGSALPAVTVITTTATAMSTTSVDVPGPTVTLPATTVSATTTLATTVTAIRTTTRTATVTTVVTRSAPTAGTTTAPAPSGANPWSSDSEQVAGAPVPQFPATLPDWRLTATWDTTTRAFSGQWSPVSGTDAERFPSTMNGCDDHRFLVRWSSTGTGSQIDAGLADATDSPDDVTTDTAGWMAFDGCQHPIVRFHGSTNELTDVAVSVQEYEPAA